MVTFWLYTALSSFGVSFNLNFVLIPISIRVRQKSHGILPEHLRLLAFLFLLAEYLSNQIYEDNSFGILYRPLDSVFFIFQFIQFYEESCLYRCMVFNFTRIFGCRKPECVSFLFWFVRSENFIEVFSDVRITFGNNAENCQFHWFKELGLFRSDYEKFGNLCISFDQIRCFCCSGYSHCHFPINFCWIEWDISKLAVSVKLSHDVTVPVVFHSDGWSAKPVIVFVVLSGFVRASSVGKAWEFALITEVVFICIVRCGKCMRFVSCHWLHCYSP